MWSTLGHSRAINLLSYALKSGQVSHAYLFVGAPNSGKMALAIDLAQAVNCQGADPPCKECRSCQHIASGNHPDVQVISTLPDKKLISIEQVKAMQADANLTPFEGRYKVFIYQDAEKLSQDASNRLLKTLEEPPSYVIIMLLTSNENDMLPTVVSRCQRIDIPAMPVKTIEDYLLANLGVPPQRARLIAWLSKGRLGWAIRATEDTAILETRKNEIAAFIELRSAGLSRRLAYSAEIAARFSKKREDVERMLDLWLLWWRDLLLVKSGNAPMVTNIDYEPELHEQAEELDLDRIYSVLMGLRQVRKQLDANVSPRLVFDVFLLTMP